MFRFDCSIAFTQQTRTHSYGEFNFGVLTGGKAIKSVAVYGTGKTFRVVLQGNGSSFTCGSTATFSDDGKYVYGRWSMNSGGKWTTGRSC